MWNTTVFLTQSDESFKDSISELLQSTTRALIYGIAAVFVIAILATAIWPDQIAVKVWIAAPIFLVISWLALRTLSRHYVAAQFVWLIGLAGVITLLIYLFDSHELAFFYILLPLSAAVTLGWQASLMMLALVFGGVWGVYHGLVTVEPRPIFFIVTGAGGIISGLLGCITTHSLLTVTEWSVYSLHEAQKNIRETRQHRGELAKVVKELDKANIQLERANHMLVLAKTEADEAKNARNRFALAISHELRSPLNFIIGFSEIMVNKPETYAPIHQWPPGLYEDVQEIYRSSQHLIRLVNDVLDLGQIDHLQMNLIKEWISLAQIVQEMSQMVRRAFAVKGINFITEVEPDLPLVYVDRTRIRQVLLNLVNNSLRFTDSGSVAVRVNKQEDTLIVCVEDTGMGIPEEDLERLFEEFNQVKSESWRRRGGAGLGLAISRRFIELHGGKMWVESQVGKGSRFFFSLPTTPWTDTLAMLSREREEQYWQDMKARAKEKRIVLVLSKDPSAAEVLSPYIEGFNIIRVGQIEKLRHQINTLYPHAILIDQTMIEKQDSSLILSHLPYDLPIITFSFPGNSRSLRDLPECVKGYLVKPVASQVLIDTIHALGKGVKQLLIVDDDSSMQSFIARVMNSTITGKRGKQTYKIVAAETVATALEEIRRSPPDVVLLDLGLPDGNGWDVLRAVELLNIPVVIITAQDFPQINSSGKVQNALTLMMRRPLARQELSPVVQTLLENVHPVYPTTPAC